jgi:hypothetical protein
MKKVTYGSEPRRRVSFRVQRYEQRLHRFGGFAQTSMVWAIACKSVGHTSGQKVKPKYRSSSRPR